MFVNVANVVIIVLLNHEKDLGQKEVMRVKKICQMPDGSLEKRLLNLKQNFKLDPVGSTVRYEMIKLCTGSV